MNCDHCPWCQRQPSRAASNYYEPERFWVWTEALTITIGTLLRLTYEVE